MFIPVSQRQKRLPPPVENGNLTVASPWASPSSPRHASQFQAASVPRSHQPIPSRLVYSRLLCKLSSAPPWLLSLPSWIIVRRRRRRRGCRAVYCCLLGRGRGERREYLVLLGRRRQLLLQMLVLHQLLLLLRLGHGKLNRIGHDEERAQEFSQETEVLITHVTGIHALSVKVGSYCTAYYLYPVHFILHGLQHAAGSCPAHFILYGIQSIAYFILYNHGLSRKYASTYNFVSFSSPICSFADPKTASFTPRSTWYQECPSRENKTQQNVLGAPTAKARVVDDAAKCRDATMKAKGRAHARAHTHTHDVAVFGPNCSYFKSSLQETGRARPLLQ